jgi:pimeloyl-ACP methyl ester carboxylesterase
MIKFSQKGKGPALIFLHGFCESKEMWITFTERFSKDFEVFCPDLPGFGETSLEQDHISLEEVAVMLQDWMGKHKIEKPIIIGHSLGGYVALAMAELMGAELKGIGLFHSTAFSDEDEKKQTRNKTITFVKKYGVDKFMDAFVPPLFSEAHRLSQEDKITELITAGKRSSKKGILAFIAAMRDRKNRIDIWKYFSGKKLFIAGEIDGAIKIEESRRHQAFATHYHELGGVGHMGMFEAESECLEIVEKFLEN